MNYSKSKGRRSAPSFVMLTNDIIDSEAWKSLSSNSQALWLHIRRRYNGYNNGDIPLSCREAGELLNISKNTAGKAFKELLDRGFIKVGSVGGFRVKKRYSTRWILTDEEFNGCKATKEWKKWKPSKDKI